jgi:SAM-dependent methyltransferase
MADDKALKAQFRAMTRGAQSLAAAYIGVVNGLFSTLARLGPATPDRLATEAGMDLAYVRRWCDAAYAHEYLDAEGETFRLTPAGEAMIPGAPGGVMPMAAQAMLNMHMAERAAALMRTGERPGEQVMAQCETLLPWFGPMLEGSFAEFFEKNVCPAVPIFAEIDARGGLAVDLGCGNGWYLRALARRCPSLRGLGLDGFEENIAQATRLAAREGLGERLRFEAGDAHQLALAEPVDLIAMNRALHHVWEAGGADFIRMIGNNLRPGGAAVIWEPNWPAERTVLRQPGRQGIAFQNLTEHVQGNHLLGAEEIAAAFAAEGFGPEIFLFSEGQEAVIVARKK